METKKILISGVAGSIGVHVLAHLLHNTDWFVVGLASFRHRGWTDRINEVVKDHPDWSNRYEVHTHDLTAPLSPILKSKIGHIDYIINLASLSDVEASIKDPTTFIQNNVWSVLNMLEYAREVKPKAFVQFSTDEVFGALVPLIRRLMKILHTILAVHTALPKHPLIIWSALIFIHTICRLLFPTAPTTMVLINFRKNYMDFLLQIY